MKTSSPISADILHAGIWSLDRDGVTTAANLRMHEMLGLEPHQLVGTPILDFVEPSNHHLIRSGLRRRAEGQRDTYDANLITADGRTVEVRIHASPVLDDAGAVVGSTAVVVDISDLTAAQAVRDVALQSAEQSATLATHLLSLASHELRTPLNTIAGFAQLLSMGLTDPHQRDMADKIAIAAGFINELCTDFVTFAHANGGALRLKTTNLDLRSLAESAVDVASGVLTSHRCIVSIEGDEHLEARADPERTVQILVNLIANAAKHGGDGNTIHLILSEVGESTVSCSVRDEGPGIPAHQHERVFLPFERLGNSQAEGTGLGLSISRTLAAAMGGDIRLESEPGNGATFSLQLPRSGNRVVSQRPLILYVEDEPLNASLVQNIVAMLPGRQCHVVESVAAGIEAASTLQPALVLLDLHLPDGSGFDVLTAIRNDPAMSDLPVFMLSADATEESVRTAHELGASRYLTKPFDLRSFLDLLEMATSRNM